MNEPRILFKCRRAFQVIQESTENPVCPAVQRRVRESPGIHTMYLKIGQQGREYIEFKRKH